MNNLLELILQIDDTLMVVIAENIIYAYLLLFSIIILETGLIIFPFLPGDGLLFSAGVVAATTDLNVWILLVLLILAAIIGNILNYHIGKLLGNKIVESNNYFVRRFFVSHMPKTKEFYLKKGGMAIILGRFMPIVRTYIPFFAGIICMEKAIFIKYSVIGAITWVASLLLLGFFVGEIEWVKHNYGVIFLGIVLASFVPLVISIIKKQIIAFLRKYKN